MAAEPHYIDVDLKKSTHYKTTTVTQNDTDVVFILRVSDDGRSDESVLDNFSTVTLTSQRRDGQSFYVLGEKIPGTNEVRFALGTKELELTGKVSASAQLYSVDGRQSSAKFNYNVEGDLTGDYVPTETEATLIEIVLMDGPATIAEAEQVAAQTVEALELLETEKTVAFQELDDVKEDNKLTWKPEVATVALRNSTYPNPQNGDTVRITEEARIDRFNGTEWITTDRYNPNALDSVNQRLTETEQSFNERIGNVVANSGDGTKDSELVDARYSPSKLTNFNSVSDRINSLEKDNFFPVKNLVVNGDFSDGLTGWSPLLSTASAANNEATFTATASKGRIERPIDDTQSTNGHLIYRSAIVKATSSLVGLGVTSTSYVFHSGSGLYERLSVIRANIGGAQFRTSVSDVRTSGWDAVSVKYVLTIDLTATFGAGKEPTKEEIDYLVSLYENYWFDGTANFSALKNISTEMLLKLRTLEKFIEEGGGEPDINIEEIVNESTAISQSYTDSALSDNMRGLEDMALMNDSMKFPKEKALFAFRFDDNDLSFYTQAFRILKKYGMVGSMSYVANRVGLYAYRPKMTDAQLRETVLAGWEVQNHSYLHLDTPLTTAEIQNEVFEAKKKLEEISGTYIRTFVKPGTWINPEPSRDSELGRALMQSHTFFEGYAGGTTQRQNYQRFGTNHKTIDNETLETVKSWVDDIVASKGALILLAHSIGDEPADHFGIDDFDALCAYIKSLQDAGKAEVVTGSGRLGARIGETQNYYGNGDFSEIGVNGLPVGYAVRSGTPTLVNDAKVGSNAMRLKYGDVLERIEFAAGLNCPSFRLSAWVKGVSGTTSSIQLRIQSSAVPDETFVVGTEWKKVSMSFTCLDPRMVIWLRGAGGGDVIVDDVRLERVG